MQVLREMQFFPHLNQTLDNFSRGKVNIDGLAVEMFDMHASGFMANSPVRSCATMHHGTVLGGQAFCLRPLEQPHGALPTSLLPGAGCTKPG